MEGQAFDGPERPCLWDLLLLLLVLQLWGVCWTSLKLSQCPAHGHLPHHSLSICLETSSH